MQSVILSAMHMHAWLPLVTSLPNDDVTFEDFSVMTPLLYTKSSTGRVSFVVSVASHNLGGKPHRRTHSKHHVCEHTTTSKLTDQHFDLIIILKCRIVKYSQDKMKGKVFKI